jgi:hypothetical protein
MISMDALHKVIDASQLTLDLEGTLHYDHSIWIELRCVSLSHSIFYFMDPWQRNMMMIIFWVAFDYNQTCVQQPPSGLLIRGRC